MCHQEVGREEIEEMERIAQEQSDFNFQMQKAEDEMWRVAVKAHIKNGVKPLMVF